jgi:hypothetical protein
MECPEEFRAHRDRFIEKKAISSLRELIKTPWANNK